MSFRVHNIPNQVDLDAGNITVTDAVIENALDRMIDLDLLWRN